MSISCLKSNFVLAWVADMLHLMLQALLASLPVHFLFLLGYYLRRKGTIDQSDARVMTHLAMDVGYPCLVFYNIVKNIGGQGDGRLSSPDFVFSAMGCGFLEMVIGVGVAYAVAKLIHLKVGSGLRTFVVSTGLQNYVFFAIPVLQILSLGADDPSLGVLFVHNVGCELFVWTLAIFLLSGRREDLKFRAMIRGPLIAVVASLSVVWLGWAPHIAHPTLMRSLELIGGLATPLPLILCGCSIYDMTRNQSWDYRVMSAGLMTRLLILPVMILLLAWALPIDPLIKRIMVIQGSIPSAVVTVMLARRFGGIPELGTQIVISTTVCCIITFPLWLVLGHLLITPMLSL